MYAFLPVLVFACKTTRTKRTRWKLPTTCKFWVWIQDLRVVKNQTTRTFCTVCSHHDGFLEKCTRKTSVNTQRIFGCVHTCKTRVKHITSIFCEITRWLACSDTKRISLYAHGENFGERAILYSRESTGKKKTLLVAKKHNEQAGEAKSLLEYKGKY